MKRPVRVVFVAPYLMPNTLRFVSAIANLPMVDLAVITHEPAARIPPSLRPKVAAHYQVQNALDPQQLADAVRAIGKARHGVDRLIGTLEQLQTPLAQVRDLLQIEGLGAEAAHNFRDKVRMKNVLRAAGLPCARHKRLHSQQEVLEFVRQVGLPVVLKPPAGAGSVATYRVKQMAELQPVLLKLQPSRQRPIIGEEFIVGRERSFETVCIAGQPVWDSLTRYDPTPLHVLENPWIQWTVLLPREHPCHDLAAIQKPGHAALRALGQHTGISHMEWFRRPDGSVAISEVAARPPGANIMPLNAYAHDIDFFRLWAGLMVHNQWQQPQRKYAVGSAFFRGQGGKGPIVAIEGLDRAQALVGPLVVEAHLPRPGHAAKHTYEGDGYAIVRHPETEVVEKALQTLISTVRIHRAA